MFVTSADGAVIPGSLSVWLANRWGTEPVVTGGMAVIGRPAAEFDCLPRDRLFSSDGTSQSEGGLGTRVCSD